MRVDSARTDHCGMRSGGGVNVSSHPVFEMSSAAPRVLLWRSGARERLLEIGPESVRILDAD